jgi:hypothetical protein
MQTFQVAGGSHGWLVAVRITLKGKPETGIYAADITYSR